MATKTQTTYHKARMINGTPAVDWQAHRKGQDILFGDGHSKWYQGYVTNEMTFRYDSMHGWE